MNRHSNQHSELKLFQAPPSENVVTAESYFSVISDMNSAVCMYKELDLTYPVGFPSLL